MADTEKSLKLEDLKVDPQMWMRLSMPVGKAGNLGNVFPTKDNPFANGGAEAMEKVKELAAAGKLYVREKGRIKHFRKVEMDGDQLKLGDKIEARADRNSDPIYGFLMRRSRSYFKWLGWDRVSNWFDKRAQEYDTVQDRKNQFKEEYKAMSKEEKSALKQLRQHEKLEAKARKKLEKLQKELDETKDELNQLLFCRIQAKRMAFKRSRV